jgi:RNA polymerase sigma-70 factor (ECF subfamily)
MGEFPANSDDTQRLLRQVRAGDHQAFESLFARHRAYLCRFAALRLDPRLRPRVDPSDVVQEAHLEAVRLVDAYLQQPPMPFRLWLRQIVHDRLLKLRRYHIASARRSLDREVPWPDQSSLLLAEGLAAPGPAPDQQFDRDELARRLRQGLARLAADDREILLLRNFEGLSYQEVGYLLHINPAAARKRHGRALLRLHAVLFDGGLTESPL